MSLLITGFFHSQIHIVRGDVDHAIMVTGGFHMNSSEVLHSNGTSMCTLPPMPDIKWAHSQSAFTACGGAVSSKTCYTFREGRWETLNDQLELLPHEHSSWMNENGDILLMGGLHGGYPVSRTELVFKNGSNVRSFDAKYLTINACTIEFLNTFIVTGGEHANVSHYDGNGWIRDYPKLNNVRRDHGCGYYMNDDMKMVLLVTGGILGGNEATSSTEVYVMGAGAWTQGPELPRALLGLRGVSVNNEVLMIGGGKFLNNATDGILKFNPTIPSWTNVGNLAEGRVDHAVSKVNLVEAYQYCGITPPTTTSTTATTTFTITTTSNGAERMVAQSTMFCSILILFFSVHI